MQLIYFDESGNTGNNLSDPNQKIFVLIALIVPESVWQKLEIELNESFAKFFPDLFERQVEVHCTDIVSGRNEFKGRKLSKRIEFRDDWMKIAAKHKLKVCYRAINKWDYSRWQTQYYGSGISINPQVSAFALLSSVLDDYLEDKGELGMFIFDDNQEVTKDIEKSLKVLKACNLEIKIDNVIEKGFFIKSSKSRVLQLCDMFAFSARKKEEFKQLDIPYKHPVESSIPLLDAISHKGEEKFWDVMDWLSGSHFSA